MKAIRISAKTMDEARAAAFKLGKPGLTIVQMAHDDGCPAIRTHRDADCRPPCRPEFWLVRPFADARDN
jgi:hypothetical protein